MKHTIYNTALTLCAALTLFACAQPVTHVTPSGKVEVTIHDTTKAKVKDHIANYMMNWGYTVVKSDDNVVAFDRPVNNPLAAAFLGSSYDATPNARISYNLMQDSRKARVIADCSIITNPGSGFERRTDANRNQDTLQVQNWLDHIKTEIEKKKGK